MRRVAPEGHKAFTWPPPARPRPEAPAPARPRLPPAAGPNTHVALTGAAILLAGIALFVAAGIQCGGSRFCGLELKVYGWMATLLGLAILLLAALAGATTRALHRTSPRHRTLK